jgi:hypothetical protein
MTGDGWMTDIGMMPLSLSLSLSLFLSFSLSLFLSFSLSACVRGRAGGRVRACGRARENFNVRRSCVHACMRRRVRS